MREEVQVKFKAMSDLIITWLFGDMNPYLREHQDWQDGRAKKALLQSLLT